MKRRVSRQIRRREPRMVESVIEKAATEQPQTNPNNLPGFGASQTKQDAKGAKTENPAAPKAPQTPAK